MFGKLKRYLKDPYFALGCDMIKRHPRWMSDRLYLATLGKMLKGEQFDIKHPKTMSEKLNWLKLHDRKPLYTTLVDKYRAKIWLAEHFGDEYIIPTLAVYQSADEIDIEALPNAFVVKCNHDSGNVFICHDKSSGIYYDKHMEPRTLGEVKQALNEGLKKNFYWEAREWAYKNVKPCIIVEKLLLKKDGSIPNDYKLFFINGEFQFTYVSFDREGVNDRCTYDEHWERMPFVYADHYNEKINTSDVPRPMSYDQMLSLGKKIANHYKFVRIDFYDVDGKMYFGEVTQFHSGGFADFYPAEYDAIYAEKLKLNI